MSAIFLYLKQDRSQLVLTQSLPEEVVPVKIYVEECAAYYAEQGVLLLGTQGGYIYLPQMIDHNPFSYISLVEGSNFKVPYWYYEGSSRAPTLQDMEDQISEYVKLNLRQCLNNFSVFERKFDINEAGNITVKTTITENNVVLTITYPVEVKPEGTKKSVLITLYDTVVPVKLKRMHRLATEILTAENKGLFLEDLTLNLMTLGPQVPFTDMEFTCKRKRWYKSEVANDIKNLLYYNLPRIRFQDTRHPPFQASMYEYEQFRKVTPEDVQAGQYPSEAPSDLYDYYHLYWDVSREDYSDLQANVYYQPDWRFDMEVRPSDGDIMDASMGRGMEDYLKFICINVYHFTYDLIYPVKIMIQDDSAFNGKGFTFSYALPVMINHNQGQREPFGVTVFETPSKDTDYCSGTREGLFRVYAKDKITFSDMKDVNITFNCMNAYYCDLGKTGKDGGVYRLTTNLPSFCRPGSVEAVKQGYLKAVETVPQYMDFVDIYMVPIKEINFRVIKRRLTAGVFQDNELLSQGDTAVMYITTQNATDYDVYAQYPFEPDTPPDMRKIPVIMDDVTYNLDIVLLKGERFIGGYRGEWTPSYEDIAASNEVVFVVMEKIPHPVTEDAQASLMLDLQNKDNLIALEPRFR